ncbi:MAG: flavin-binding protein dodecin [Gammaproteobacteria bacterium]|jgi:flavin-binding protein dodecin
MSVAKVTEIKSTSKTSFDDAIKKGIAKAANSIDDI